MISFLISFVVSTASPQNPHLADSVWPTTHQNSWNTDEAAVPGLIDTEDDLTWRMFVSPTITYRPENFTMGRYSEDIQSWLNFVKVGVLPEAYPYRFTITHLFSSDRKSIYVRSSMGMYKVGIKSDGTYQELARWEEAKVPKAYYCFLSSEGGEEYVYAAADNYVVKLNSDFKNLVLTQLTETPCGVVSSDDALACNVIHSMAMGYNGVFFVAMTKTLFFAMSLSMEVLDKINLTEHIYARNVSLTIGESFAIINDIATGDQHIFIPVSNYLVKIIWSDNFTDVSYVQLGSTGLELGRIGDGIGSSPSVMGSGDGPFHIVVTDGNLPMNIWFVSSADLTYYSSKVLMGHGENFTNVTSEQSVVISGNRAAVVNNYFELWKPGFPWEMMCNHASDWIENGCRVSLGVASYGVEQFEFDETTGEIKSVWVNRNVSCASSIPVVSAPDQSGNQILYCIGADNIENYGLGNTTLEAINWTTGESIFSYNLGRNSLLGPAWSDTQIGLYSDIYYGAVGGIVHIFYEGSVYNNTWDDAQITETNDANNQNLSDEELHFIILGTFSGIFFFCWIFWCGRAWHLNRKLRVAEKTDTARQADL